MAKEFKSGFIAVIGRPNVGKSTLINNFIGQKVVIMSDRPQTTRNKILCVQTLEDAQLVFIDTPGIHKPQNKLGQYMVDTAQSTLHDVDAVLLVVDGEAGCGAGDEFIIDSLNGLKTPVILAINKIDRISNEKILPLIKKYDALYGFKAIVPISALTNTNVGGLTQELCKCLLPGPKYYPDDMVTDQPERLIIAELIREKALLMTRDEVPHSLAVDIEDIKNRENGKLFVRAVIYVERDSQKGIIIGAKGRMLREIGRQARADIEKLSGSAVFLDLWVKVKKDWRNQDSSLKMFGYE